MIKGVKNRLKIVRDSAAQNGALSEADTAMLRTILHEMSPAGNDNSILNDDQRARLSIVEKTGTGSKYVH